MHAVSIDTMVVKDYRFCRCMGFHAFLDASLPATSSLSLVTVQSSKIEDLHLLVLELSHTAV
jgi:hypothetical protein